jgi:hypothetical protein
MYSLISRAFPTDLHRFQLGDEQAFVILFKLLQIIAVDKLYVIGEVLSYTFPGRVIGILNSDAVVWQC